jgi:hypothetical protein
MKNPVVLHVVRPYRDEQEYLAAEAWTIDDRGMFLIDDRELAPDTAVVFDVALSSGMKVIRAEGRVEHHVPAEGMQPAGLRVRFRRFGEQTKAFIDRAIGYAERRTAAPPTQRPGAGPPSSRRGPASERTPLSGRAPSGTSRPPPLPPRRRSLTPPAGTVLPSASSPPASEGAAPASESAAPASAARLQTEAVPILPASVRPGHSTLPGLGSEPPQLPELLMLPKGWPEPAPSSRPADSGVHTVEGAPPRPMNRDELLARLRERAKAPDSGEFDASGRASRPKG